MLLYDAGGVIVKAVAGWEKSGGLSRRTHRDGSARWCHGYDTREAFGDVKERPIGEAALTFEVVTRDTRGRARLARMRTPNGLLTGLFMICYAIFRIIVEYFREPDASMIGIFTRGQFFSFFVIALGIGFIVVAKRRPTYPKQSA